MDLKRSYYYKIINFVDFIYDLSPSSFSKLVGLYYDSRIDYSIHIKELNCVYIPVPKAGTKSIKKVFADYLHNELSDQRFNLFQSNKKNLPFNRITKEEVGQLKGDHFIFSFVRNPYDRILSCFFDKVHKKTSYRGFLRYNKRFYRGMTFDRFVEEISDIPDSEADQHFRSQHKFLTDAQQTLLPHYVGKLENMAADFKKIHSRLNTDRLELTHINKSKSKKVNHDKFLTPEVQKRIQERYETDFQLFNYPFEYDG